VRPRLAVLDDEVRMVDVLAMLLRGEGYDVEPFTEPDTALAALEKHGFDLLITDLRMPRADGLEVLRRARTLDPELPVVLITAHASVPTAIAAMREGAFDYVEKPFDNDELKLLLARALDVTRLSRENRHLRAAVRSRYAVGEIVAESLGMQAVFDLARRAARSSSTVLITGESGTGKELVARAVHYHSDRVGEPFVAVNCKSLASGVLESELFGHEKGAFTGADRARPGLFEQAHRGTLFLDEIAEVEVDFQAKLLRVLQDREVRRVGATDGRTLDVRIVAATNRDLRAEVEAGRFREDLYFRLAVIPVAIPPLRERPEDVLPLARHFLARWSRELDRPELAFGDGVEGRLEAHAWPGNVRELENAVERGAVLARGDRIELEDLLLEAATTEPPSTLAGGDSLRERLDAATADCVRGALRDADGSRAEAARRLGVDRTTLYRLMRKHGIEAGADT
jgi:DNA-binding NtrC family response regulator